MWQRLCSVTLCSVNTRVGVGEGMGGEGSAMMKHIPRQRALTVNMEDSWCSQTAAYSAKVCRCRVRKMCQWKVPFLSDPLYLCVWKSWPGGRSGNRYSCVASRFVSHLHDHRPVCSHTQSQSSDAQCYIVGTVGGQSVSKGKPLGYNSNQQLEFFIYFFYFSQGSAGCCAFFVHK